MTVEAGGAGSGRERVLEVGGGDHESALRRQTRGADSERRATVMAKQAGPPDGGLRACFVAMASFFCNGIIFGIMNTFGIIYVTLEEELAPHVTHAASKACQYL